MPLEAKIELLTAAVIELTCIITGQVRGFHAETASVGVPLKFDDKVELPKVTSTLTMPEPEQLKSTPDTSQPSAEESKPALTYVDNVKPITLRLSKEKSRETAIAVLSRFGVKGAQDLDAGQWADYIAHCEKVLAGGEV